MVSSKINKSLLTETVFFNYRF